MNMNKILFSNKSYFTIHCDITGEYTLFFVSSFICHLIRNMAIQYILNDINHCGIEYL